MIIFNTKNYSKAAHELNSKVNSNLGRIERKSFPDGETYLRILTDTKDKDIIVLGGTGSDEETLELFDLCLTLSNKNEKSQSFYFIFWIFYNGTLCKRRRSCKRVS